MFEYVIFSFFIAVKLMMAGADQSTDFEVHRNWKAITNTLPLNKWYFDETSEWTLDYPPMFAYMEYILGFISKFVDERIIHLNNLNYSATACVLFQRVTVVFGDFLLFIAIKRLSKSLSLDKRNSIYLSILIQGFAGLVLVDNLHFQYNTLLFAVFLFSLSLIFSESYLAGAVVYAILLNMKHIFLYLAPAYFVFYLKYYVFKNKKFNFFNLLILGLSVILVFLLSFSPFIYFSIRDHSLSQITQILKRLFPFKRGLLHSYWAPNFWAFYSFLDKVLFTLFTKFQLIKSIKSNSSSIGINQDINFDVMINISTKFANLLIIIICLLFIIKCLLFEKYQPSLKKINLTFIRYTIISSLIFFNFGFQVHEKAYIMISLLSIIFFIYSDRNKVQKSFLLLSVYVGIFSQMPLIHTLKDYIVKLFIVLSYLILFKIFIKSSKRKQNFSNKHSFLTQIVSNITPYYIALCLTLDFIVVIYPLIDLKQLIINDISQSEILIIISNFKDKFQFLPLMLFSVIHSIAVQIALYSSFNLEKGEESLFQTLPEQEKIN